MKVYEVDNKEFYKGYTLKNLLFFRKRLDLVEKELNAGNLEQALVLVMDSPYIEYPEFNFYRINILIRLGHLDLALDVASDSKFKDFKPIQIQKEGLESVIRFMDEQEKINRQEENKIEDNSIKQDIDKASVVENIYALDEVSVDSLALKIELMTKLYVGILSLEEIENANLSQFDRILFKICYYDKYNHAVGLSYIKSIKDKITTDSERKTINNLRSRLESKRNNYFNIAVYRDYLCGVDFEYALELKQQIKEEEEIKKQQENKIEDNSIKQDIDKQSAVENPDAINEVSVDSLTLKTKLLTKLYVGVLSFDEIENANLPQFEKILFKICYYDKYNHAAGLKYIKLIKDKITTDSERKVINSLRSRLESKHNNYFNIDFYKNYLCRVDYDYVSELKQQIKEQENQSKLEETRQTELLEQKSNKDKEEVYFQEVFPVENETEEVSQPIQTVEDTTPKEMTVHKLEESKEIKIVKAKKNKKGKKAKVEKENTSIVRIKDAFPIEVEAIGSYVYVQANNQMTTNSVKAFDIFESIVNQDVNNINALKKFESLVIKFSSDRRIGVTYNEERFNKYLKKE